MRKEIFWAIKGKYGFYTGTWITRKEAIWEHTKRLGKTWDYCKKKGDRAFRVQVIEIIKPTKEVL